MTSFKSLPQHFKPGQSGNPNGRPRIEIGVRELARKYTKEALETLAEIMKHGEDRDRINAINIILERGYGKVPQAVTTANLTTGEITVQTMIDVPPQETLEEWIERKRKEDAIEIDKSE